MNCSIIKRCLPVILTLHSIVFPGSNDAADSSGADASVMGILNGAAFTEYPQNDGDLTSRKKQLRIIQNCAARVGALTYMKYMRSWNANPAKADALEAGHEALQYLRQATETAISAIAETRVDSGLVCWYFYNMGYVFRTSASTVGIDLHFRGAEKLAPSLDVLLITHAHHDHYSRELIDAMIGLKKPVITGFYPNTIKIRKDTALFIGTVRIKTDIGDHHRHVPVVSSNNMIMYQIDFHEGTKTRSIYHAGDGNNVRKMKPDKPIDIFIVHTQLPMPLSTAVYHIKPKITFASHVLELSHSGGLPLPLRWSYDYCFRQMAKVKGYKVITPAWGERWVSEGCVNSAPGAPPDRN